MCRHCLTGHAKGMECWRPWHDDFPNSGWREGNHNYQAWSRHPYSTESSLCRGLRAIWAVCCPRVSSLMLCTGPGGSLRLCQDPERWVWRGMRGFCTHPWHSVAMLREVSPVLRAALGIPLACSINVIRGGRIQEAELTCSCLPTHAGAEESQKRRAAPA